MPLRLSRITKGSVAIMSAALLSLVASSPIRALSLEDVINGNYRGDGQPAELFDGTTAIIPRMINLMLFIVGVLAIVMLIFGGIRYVISGGDSGRVKDAKNTILYAIVGLIVAILGYAIVSWVVSVVGSGSGTGGV